MPTESLEYFRVRAAEERKRASAAPSENIRAIHLELAQRYEHACGRVDTDLHMQSSRDAIARSLNLLSTTSLPVLDT